MRLLKLAFISLVVLFIIVTAISLIIPSHIRLTKQITIRPEKDSIFFLLKNKSEWPRWHPSFLNGDHPEMLGSIQLRVLSERDSILTMQWLQKDKKPLNMGWQLFNTDDSPLATLQWYMDFDLKWYPWQKIGSLFYESNYGAMMEQGLHNIKEAIEK